MHKKLEQKLSSANKAVKKRKLQWQIFQYLLLFNCLLLAILWVFQSVFLDSFYRVVKSNEIKRDTEAIAYQIEHQDINTMADIITSKGSLYVEIWTPTNSIFMTSGNYPRGAKALTEEQRIELYHSAESVNGETTIYIPGGYRTEGKEQEVIVHAQILNNEQPEPMMLIVSANLLPVSSTIATLRLQLVCISAIMVVLSVFLALLISRRIAHPIEEINQKAKELGEGNYEVDFPESSGYLEIQQLSDTLSQASVELSKTEHLRRELVANVSHDLRTPLTLITGYAEMMQEFPGEMTAENLQVIVDESKRLSLLVNDLLELSRLQSKTLEMHVEYFNLTEMVDDIIGRFSKFCKKDNYQIEFIKTQEVMVEADPDRLAQVVYNLIGNAINYTGEEKKVVVVQNVENNRVTIRIIDTGSGMDEDSMRHVWERYYRNPKTHARSTAGSGLGLSIVRSILEQQEGVLYGVDSTLGVGSEFWFSLPIVNESEFLSRLENVTK